jgi:hypothetical protein
MTVARMRQEMSSAEYTSWCAYWALEAQKQEMAAKR